MRIKIKRMGNSNAHIERNKCQRCDVLSIQIIGIHTTGQCPIFCPRCGKLGRHDTKECPIHEREVWRAGLLQHEKQQTLHNTFEVYECPD